MVRNEPLGLPGRGQDRGTSQSYEARGPPFLHLPPRARFFLEEKFFASRRGQFNERFGLGSLWLGSLRARLLRRGGSLAKFGAKVFHERFMQNSKILHAHLCLVSAAVIWGLMAPVGKAAMLSGITGIDMVFFRTTGAAISFWLISLCTAKMRSEKVPLRDLLKLFGAGFFSIVGNQTCYNIGLSITSPINATIATTSLPIFALISSAIFLHERITWKKVLGIALGLSGTLILILGSASATNAKAGNIAGDLLCVTAQCCFAIYLALFKDVISRYNTITCMKWMFTFSAVTTLPLTLPQVLQIPFAQVQAVTWTEIAFVVLGGTFLAYLLMMHAQKTLSPTIVAMYNYVQPTVSSVVSVAVGLAIFGPSQALAILLIILGVYTVNMAKAKIRH